MVKNSPYLTAITVGFSSKIAVQSFISNPRLELIVLDAISMVVITLSALHMFKSFKDTMKAREEWDELFEKRMFYLLEFESQLRREKKNFYNLQKSKAKEQKERV